MPSADHRPSLRWPPFWAVVSSLCLGVIGLGISAYLTYAHYAGGDVLACPDTGTVNCAKVTSSSQSEVFGVFPVAVLGLSFFAAVVALCLPQAWRSRVETVHLARLVAAGVGVAMVVYLVYAELFQIHAICLYCTAVHTVAVLLFAVVVFSDQERRALL